MLLILSYSESAYPITPVEPLKPSLYDYFGISVYFVYFRPLLMRNLFQLQKCTHKGRERAVSHYHYVII